MNIVLIIPFGIHGAAIATIIAYGFAAVLNLLAIRSEYDNGIGRQFVLKVIFSVLFMATFVLVTKWGIITILQDYFDSKRLIMGIVTFMAILIGVISYLFALLWTGTITKRELLSIPKFGVKFNQIIDSIKLTKFLKD